MQYSTSPIPVNHPHGGILEGGIRGGKLGFQKREFGKMDPSLESDYPYLTALVIDMTCKNAAR
jgi:hypothetical protein